MTGSVPSITCWNSPTTRSTPTRGSAGHKIKGEKMDVFLSWLKDNFPPRISVPLAVLITTLIGTFHFPLENYISDTLQNQLSKTPNIRWIAMLFLSILIFAISYLLLYRSHKSIRRNYNFDKRIGIYFHKKTREPFCPSCLASDIESPLKESADSWRCMRKDCSMGYHNPDYNAPPRPPDPPRRPSWATGWCR